MANEQSVARWYDAYPKVKSQRLEPISRSDLLDLIHSGALPGRDFLLVDLRRDDHRVCHIGIQLLVLIMTCLGRHHTRLLESPCTDTIPVFTYDIHSREDCQNIKGDLVLW